mmetsp:Transcript_43600/g.136809  ORF Transcript_43600/g.136809 Transcript_43600/m.136809 type:complete len:153 (-) Transcript_43600:541-999(-)|eukprot:CAMPEP_0118852050 /NCGR_PEP_ID=MMETSP1163-20130328/1235_1 /TAXON_ID=124430 /ORGANISM="Phaeomonas parva, Strain CCMP2877" /LENGTH=152 /DNA_ID=CAMNT_0006784449 /DNA_START=179 /DNA_END=637 /DNA_ORIENTATION=-
MSSSSEATLSWSTLTRAEHDTFVRVLEAQSPKPTPQTWRGLVAALDGRSEEEIKVHAMRYLCALMDSSNAPLTFESIRPHDAPPVGNWTAEDNSLFEQATALMDSRDPERWEKLAQIFPNKNAEDMRTHYQRLLMQVVEADGGAAGTGQPKL